MRGTRAIYIPDTNACIQYLNKPHSPVTKKFSADAQGDIAFCDIVKMELYYGAYRSARQQDNLALLKRFFVPFLSLPFDDVAAEICGRLRASLAAAGTPIGPYDLQIAAIALASGLTLVMHNTREFSRVPGLQPEDWE